MNEAHLITAAVLVIGDEILSGRIQDVNVATIAKFLAPLGIDLAEARFVRDVQAEIVAAVNALRSRYSYVFTTGGIGPTMTNIIHAASPAVKPHPDMCSGRAPQTDGGSTGCAFWWSMS
jgi:molybdopterin-biosynthesis enzyme MoeA-like protein